VSLKNKYEVSRVVRGGLLALVMESGVKILEKTGMFLFDLEFCFIIVVLGISLLKLFN